jgi:uncharacterized protein (TIGR03435 family)
MFGNWFDIEARMSEASIAALGKMGPPERDEYQRQLLQSLLVDRFKLRVHHVSVVTSCWELEVLKGGIRNLKKSPDSAETKPGSGPIDMNHISRQGAPISMLIIPLEMLEDAPVIDKTGLTGKYDFSLEFARDPDMPMLPSTSLPSGNDSEPSIFTALKEQLGLQMVRVKLPLDEIVIDHIEKPSPN